MKNILKSLVLLWVSSMAMPVLASSNDSAGKKGASNINRIIIIEKNAASSTNSNKKQLSSRGNKDDEDERMVVSSAPTSKVERDNISEPVVRSKAKYRAPKPEMKSKYPRLKRIYFAANAGYFRPRKNAQLYDANGCIGMLTADFVCKDFGDARPIDIEYKDVSFWNGALGINTTGPFRFELSYFQLGKDLAVSGINTIGFDNRKYSSSLDLKGGSANLYFDFVAHRRDPYFLLVPYIMGGVGISNIRLADTTFVGSDTTTQYAVLGSKKKNDTKLLGAGFSIGVNNYIAFDIGYRYYDFGKIKSSPILRETIPATADDEDDTINLYDLQLETKLKAHIATIGLRIQI